MANEIFKCSKTVSHSHVLFLSLKRNCIRVYVRNPIILTFTLFDTRLKNSSTRCHRMTKVRKSSCKSCPHYRRRAIALLQSCSLNSRRYVIV